MLGTGGELELKVDGIEGRWQDWEEKGTKQAAVGRRSADGGLEDVRYRPVISRTSSLAPPPLTSETSSSSLGAEPRSSKPTSAVSLVIQAISLIEHLPATTLTSSRATPSHVSPLSLPILIFDPNLSLEYDAHDTRKPFPSFEHHDWRSVRVGKKGWKVRAPAEYGRGAGGSLKGGGGRKEEGPAVQCRMEGARCKLALVSFD
jgi:hypothetical protein